MTTSDTRQLSILVDRLRAGEEDAREPLIRAAMDQLVSLSRKMLRTFPAVRRWEETGDVLQNSLIRLDRALRVVPPSSSREFFGLAAEQIRRELLDLTRYYFGSQSVGTHRSPVRPGDTSGFDPPAHESVDLDQWTAFHVAVEGLPDEDREAFMLIFYHDWPHADVAELFDVSERTVGRRWKSAIIALKRRLGRSFPND